MSYLQYKIDELGDVGTQKLLERLSPKGKVAKLYELFEMSLDTSYDTRSVATGRYARYLCAAIQDLEDKHWVGCGFKTLELAYGQMRSCESDNTYNGAKVAIVQCVLWLWCRSDAKEKDIDDMFRWVAVQFMRDTNVVAGKIREELREANFTHCLKSPRLERAILILCNEYEENWYSVTKLFRSLLFVWIEKQIGNDHNAPFSRVRRIIEAARELPA